MATHSFIENHVAGFLSPLPENVRKSLERDWPTVPVEQIERAFQTYLLVRDAVKDQPSAATIKQGVQDFRDQVSAMLPIVERLTKNNVGSLIREKSRQHYEALDLLQKQLWIMRIVLPKVIEELPAGHLRNPRDELVLSIGVIVKAAGEGADARPYGAVCQVVGLLLASAGENATNVPQIVRTVLKKMGWI